MLCASIPFDDESFQRIFECHGKQLIITPVSKMTFFSTNIGSFLSFLLSLLQEVEVSSLHLSLSEFHAPFSSLLLCLYLLIFFIFSPDQISIITAICVLITIKKNKFKKKKDKNSLRRHMSRTHWVDQRWLGSFAQRFTGITQSHLSVVCHTCLIIIMLHD